MFIEAAPQAAQRRSASTATEGEWARCKVGKHVSLSPTHKGAEEPVLMGKLQM